MGAYERQEFERAVAGINRIPDPGDAGTIVVDRSPAVCILTTGASGETRTLAEPTAPGIRVQLSMSVHGGGDAVVTVAGTVNQTGNNTITFGVATDVIFLESIPLTATTYRWVDAGKDGAALSTV